VAASSAVGLTGHGAVHDEAIHLDHKIGKGARNQDSHEPSLATVNTPVLTDLCRGPTIECNSNDWL